MTRTATRNLSTTFLRGRKIFRREGERTPFVATFTSHIRATVVVAAAVAVDAQTAPTATWKTAWARARLPTAPTALIRVV